MGIVLNKKLVLISLILFIITLCVQNAFALTANSSSYSVSMFGTGMATGNASSTNYNLTFLSEAKGTTRNAESTSYTGNIGFFDNTIYYRTVSITSASISPTSAVVGSTIGLSISALNYQSVWAVITSPNLQVQTLNLINDATVNYVPSPSVVGTYQVIFYANSSAGAIASVIDSFELTAQQQQQRQQQQSGGGGGGTTSCIYNWDCTPWSVCSDGKQTRGCKNIGTCTGTESKPIEEMLCSTALFDVVLKLKSIELTENRTLKFNVDLTEKMGVEKIDVHIKYSIINKENYEIFSQIETKAIEKNLSYEKEIKEITLVDGEYILRVDVLYGNLQRAFTEYKIEISNGKIGTREIKKESIIIPIITIFLILIIIVLILIVLYYRKKIKESLRKVKAKHLIILLFSLVTITSLLIIGNKVTGFAVNNLDTIKNNFGVVWIFLIVGLIGLFIFIYRKKIKEIIEKIKVKSKKESQNNSIKELIKKKVYTDEGDCVGKVEEVILGKNRIGSLKIKLNKKHKLKTKGIVVNYKNIKNTGHIVIVDDKVLKKSSHLAKLKKSKKS